VEAVRKLRGNGERLVQLVGTPLNPATAGRGGSHARLISLMVSPLILVLDVSSRISPFLPSLPLSLSGPFPSLAKGTVVLQDFPPPNLDLAALDSIRNVPSIRRRRSRAWDRRAAIELSPFLRVLDSSSICNSLRESEHAFSLIYSHDDRSGTLSIEPSAVTRALTRTPLCLVCADDSARPLLIFARTIR